MNKSKYLQRLSRVAFTACILAICLAIVLAFLCQNGVSELISSAEVINTTGRQRTLSQRMTNLAGIELIGLQSSLGRSSTSKNLETIAICAKEIQIGYAHIQNKLSRFRSNETLLQVQACLARTEEYRNGQLDAVRRFLAEFDANNPEKSRAVYSEMIRHSESFLPEMEQATAVLQRNRQQEVRYLQRILWFYFGTFGALFSGIFVLFVLPSIRLAREENDKRLAEVERLKQLATISERTTNAVIFTDPHSRILWVNESFTRITGYSCEEVVGKVPGHFLQCSETSSKTVERIRAAIKNEDCFNDVILNRAKDGRKYWLHIDLQPTYSEEGIHTGFVAIETDVTETKRFQHELEESTRFLHGAIDSIPSHIAIVDEHGTILFVNSHWKSFAEQNGYEEPNFGVGSNYLDITECDTQSGGAIAADVVRGIRSVISGENQSFEIEYPCDSQSEVRWFLMTVSRFDCQEPIRLVISHLNITERKMAQQRLEELNRQLNNDLQARTLAEQKLLEVNTYLDVYRKIVDHHAIVAETDTSGTIVAVNDAFCRISGYTREELVGQNHRILNSGIHPKEMWIDMYKSVAKGGFWHGEVCNRNKNGKLYWVDTTIAPLFNDSGKVRGYFAIRADITSLKKAQAQAESASRSKSDFLANMSHEIRTPMTAILGYADILDEINRSGLPSDGSADCINTIKRNGEHLLSIINDILDISKIEADKMAVEKIKVSPIEIINEVVNLMKVKSEAKGLSLDTKFIGSIPKTILTDPTRLRQILVNLVGNGIKFTEIGGVTISVRMDEFNPELIVFDIIDTGIGLSDDQVAMLFQAFEQVDTSMTRKFGGTGLGLRISKRLAEILGGDITVSCAVGGGCRFSASIATGSLVDVDRIEIKPTQPMEIAKVSKHEVPSSNDVVKTQVQRLDGLRILLVEDGPDNQRLISFVLRKAGAIVDILENGKMAVERFTIDGTIDGALSQVVDIDLVLMDMQMPEMDGYMATRILRDKGVTLPILALTAHAMAMDEAKCLEAGCDIRLTKPIDKAALIEACVRWTMETVR